jgi:uncharacterized protein YdeI (YjbR/CyaY-like superfamily)
MKPIFFASPAAFRQWLEKHHDTTDELLVGFHKKGSGKPSITWPESVDAALCFGWIDGVRRRIDDVSYSIRFTPRRRRSIWSVVNIRRAHALTEMGLMHAAGLEAFAARDEKLSAVYSFEQRTAAKLGAAYERQFRANKGAWTFFQAQPPGYRKTATFWVVSAKREETRLKRLAKLIDDSAHERSISPLIRVRPAE